MSPETQTLGILEASIQAESAIIEKETGRIIWSTSTLYPKLGVAGVHFKATVLSSLLLFSFLGILAHFIRQRFDFGSGQKSGQLLHEIIFFSVVKYTLLRLPKFNESFVLIISLLYLLEAWNCSTRKYLANAIIAPSELEVFIEKLRNEAPVVTWKVRCFHYEQPSWLSPIQTFKSGWKMLGRKEVKALTGPGSTPSDSNTIKSNIPPVVQRESEDTLGPFRKKVVSHESQVQYNFGSFLDDTIAGVWKRQDAVSNEAAPFMKIVLQKILVLANQDAKNDYFKQQSSFITTDGMRDTYAEYSTNIEVNGFKERMLAIRPVQGVPSAKLFRQKTFWLFTFLGLSLPYRIWFARHCDQLKVSVVKETYANVADKSSTFSSWFTSKTATTQAPAEAVTMIDEFRAKMQSLLLYAQREEPQLTLQASHSHGDSDNDPSHHAPATISPFANDLNATSAPRPPVAEDGRGDTSSTVGGEIITEGHNASSAAKVHQNPAPTQATVDGQELSTGRGEGT